MRDGVTGRLVPERDAAALASAIGAAAGATRRRARGWATRGARRWSMRDFGWARVAERFEMRLRCQAASSMSLDYREFYRGRRVLVTGGLGFIGSNLARHLVDLGADVLLVDSLIPDYGGNLFNVAGHRRSRLRVNIADVRQASTMNYLVRGRDVIFNLAGQVSHIDSMRDPHTDLDINCRSQLTMLEACRQHNPATKVVFAGTRQIYGTPRSPAGRRNAPRAADRHQRHQQGRRRVLPSRLQQRLRRARVLAAADQRLRAAPADPAQPPGLHRLVHPAGARRPGDSDLRRRHRRSATSSTSTTSPTRSCAPAPPTPATATSSTSAAASRSRIAIWSSC